MGLIGDLSLRQKLTLISMAPAMAGLLVFLGASTVHDRQVYRNVLRNDLTSAAHMLAYNSAALLEFGDVLEGVKLLEAASIYNDVDYACIFDRDGEFFTEFVRPDRHTVRAPTYPLPEGAYFEPNGVAVYYPVRHGGEVLGTIYLHSTLDSYNARVKQKLITIAFLLLISGSFTVVLALRFQRLIYDPIVQLAGAARTISRTNDYGLRVIRQSNDEIGDLVEQFNRMLHRVQEKNNELRNEIVVRQAAEQQTAAANEELHFEINQRAQAEEQLGVLLATLERKNEELQDFAYVVSHDLKAPLRGINSLATWLAKDYGSNLDEKGHRYLEQLQERSRRMHTLIEGILKYSRLDRAAISPELLDSHAVARQVLDTLAPPESICIEINGQLPHVYYDRIMLLQIFQNLVGNAIQHMGRADGTIVISCRPLRTEWEFSVRDDGIGIETRHFERIFRIFQSLKTGKENETSGVGLALVKKIVERNHGRVRVESVPGEGATFFFTVPMGSEKASHLGPLEVLIVDANADYAAMTGRLLEIAGHGVTLATTWEQAAAILSSPPARLDVILWDPDNLDAPVEAMLESLGRLHPKPRIVACPARDSETMALLEGLPGLAGILYKPFTMEKLSAILSAGENSPAR
jgi:signal transduction histidine kinase/CheY-like chemotaxis protein